jgi:hypothetical protein
VSGAEIAPWIADECFEDLDAPIPRLAATDTPVAYVPTLENAILPQTADISRDLQNLLRYEPDATAIRRRRGALRAWTWRWSSRGRRR